MAGPAMNNKHVKMDIMGMGPLIKALQRQKPIRKLAKLKE